MILSRKNNSYFTNNGKIFNTMSFWVRGNLANVFFNFYQQRSFHTIYTIYRIKKK